VNVPEKDDELEELCYSVNRGKPYGREQWANRIIDRFNLESTIRDPWSPSDPVVVVSGCNQFLRENQKLKKEVAQ
jgi:hypothetical protein